MKLLLLLAAIILTTITTSAPALAEDLPGRTLPLEVKLNQNLTGMPQRDIEANLLIKQHCTKCHSESRIMNALLLMHSNQDENYDKEVKNIISRKIRLTNGDISRQDGKRIIEYLVSIWHRQKSGEKTAS